MEEEGREVGEEREGEKGGKEWRENDGKMKW